jgi:PTS system nitrogen regulatory IIA component
MHLSDLLDKRFILFLDATSRDEAIHELIDKLDAEQVLPDAKAFRDAIQHRESLVSTAIGSGVAVPHARMESYAQFFLAVGIQRTQGLDWNALDQVPVRLVFLIGGPGDQQMEYLQLLSSLTHTIKDPELRKQLLQSTSVEEVINLLT